MRSGGFGEIMTTARARNYAGMSADERRLARRERLIEGAIRAYGELIGHRRIAQATADDVAAGAAMLLSLFLRDPQLQKFATVVDRRYKKHCQSILESCKN